MTTTDPFDPPRGPISEAELRRAVAEGRRLHARAIRAAFAAGFSALGRGLVRLVADSPRLQRHSGRSLPLRVPGCPPGQPC